MTDDTWRSVLDQYYGFTDAVLLDEIKSHNSHYRIDSSAAGELMLSCREIQGGLARFRFTQMLLSDLRPYLETLQPPRLTKSGLAYVSRAGHFWQLADFVGTDHADWTSADLISDSAHRLAEFHEVASLRRINFPFAQSDLASFEWSMHEWDKSIDGHVKPFVRSGKYDDETVRTVIDFAGHLRRLAVECRDLVETHGLFGITHQDYRPANLCVVEGKVKYIWDWDLARNDVVLYDVAFASMQFGTREVVFPQFHVGRAELFITEYAAARHIDVNQGPFRRILSWCFVAVVLKRLLNGWHVDSRRQVLRELMEAGLIKV
jgi:hypothetical protein